MPIPDDLDADALIARLAGPLLPPDRDAFRRAAEDALTRVPCWGEGAVYRAVAELQARYFHPPDDRRDAWDVGDDVRVTKLQAAPVVGHSRRGNGYLRRKVGA
jgi:hypothetical protein